MMISTSSWQAQLRPLKHSATPIDVQEVNLHEVSTLAPNINLIKSALNKLESEKDLLTHTVLDLKQLIGRMNIEHHRSSERSKRIQVELENQIRKANNALEISREYSGELSSMALFWKEFIE